MKEIKGLWKGIRDKWDGFWIGDEYDHSKKHLSQSDKRFLLYGNFISSIFTVAFVVMIIGFHNLRVNHQNVEYMKSIMEMTKSYMGSATEDEYDKIVQTIRNDLVFSDYSKGLQKYAKYIPNASEKCHTCKGSSAAQAILVSLNTGNSYDLDLTRKETEEGQGGVKVAFGYDEISQTRIRMIKSPERKEGTVEIERGSGIVSLHRMKSLFCDRCIENILKAIEGQEMEEFVIFDTKKIIFYPIKHGDKVQIGNDMLEVAYKNGDCEIEITFVDRER